MGGFSPFAAPDGQVQAPGFEEENRQAVFRIYPGIADQEPVGTMSVHTLSSGYQPGGPYFLYNHGFI